MTETASSVLRRLRYSALRRNGFSLIELVVVIGIVSLISTIILIRFPALRLQTRVNVTAQKIVNSVREARRRSTSIVEFSPGTGLYPSYGIFFDTSSPTQIILYADCIFDDSGDGIIDNNDNFTYNSSSTSCNGTNGHVQTIPLESGVKITAMRTFTSNPIAGMNETKGAVEYLRPEPSIWVSDSTGTLIGVGGLAIDVADQNNTWKKTVVIWITGDVEIL